MQGLGFKTRPPQKKKKLGVVKVVLIRVIKEKVINIVLKSEMTQLFLDIFFYK